MAGFRDAIRLVTPFEIRRKLLNTRFALRKQTSFLRVLPDFMIIGTMRGGTSSLFKYLGSHPLVIPSLRKETWYFSNQKCYKRGVDWYRTHFPTRQFKRCLELIKGHNPLTFEASANYLDHPDAAIRAAGILPNVKLIVMLRNPVDRLYSHYMYNYQRGVEKRSLDEIVNEGIRFIDQNNGRLERSDHGRAIEKAFMYIYIGLYAEHLQNWLTYFPKENLLILSSEDFFKQTADIYQRIVTFLHLPSWRPKQFRNYSHWGRKRTDNKSAPSMESSMRQDLLRWYAPHNERLFQMIGQDFQWND